MTRCSLCGNAVVQHGFRCNIKSGYESTSVQPADTISCELCLFRTAAHHLCSYFTHIRFQLFAGHLHRFSRQIGGGGRIGTGVIWGGIRVCPKHLYLVYRTIHTLCCHLGKDRITACTHIRSTDHQIIETFVSQLHGSGTYVQIRYTGALHGESHTCRPHLSISHIPNREFFIPVENIFTFCNTAIQCTGIRLLTVIRRHDHAFPDNILFTECNGIHVKPCSQLIDSTLYCKKSLRCTVTTVSSGRLNVRIDHVIGKPVCLQTSGVKRNGFMSGQTYRCRSMLAKCSCIRQGIHIQRTDLSFL